MAISRAFIALPVASYGEALQGARTQAKSCSNQLRWVAAENLHLTLVFLGRLSAARLQDTCTIICNVAAQFKAFDICFTRVGPFPEGRRPKVLAALPEHSDSLCKLQGALAHGLQALTIYKPEREYRPHITVARYTHAQADVEPVTIEFDYTVAELHLYQSEQTRADVRYRSLCSAVLGQ